MDGGNEISRFMKYVPEDARKRNIQSELEHYIPYEEIESFREAFKDYSLKNEQDGAFFYNEDTIRETRKKTRTIHTE
jgi:UDP-N-acetylmuramate-alanine ligase